MIAPLLLLSLALQTPAPAPATSPADDGRIVVTPLAAQRNVDEGLVNVLSDVMLSELSKRGYSVVGYSDIQAMLDNEASKSMLACDGTNCLAELGDAMGAKLLLHSSLGRVGSQYVLNFKLIDVEHSAVRNRVTRYVAGIDEGALIAEVTSAVVELMGEPTNTSIEPPAPLPDGDGGSIMPVVVGASGAVISAVGVGVGAFFGVAAQNAIKVSPLDPRYPASVAEANDNALYSNVGWVAAGAGVAVVAVGAALMMLEP